MADDGIRYMRPEVTLLHKALADRRKDRADLEVTWPLLTDEARAWLRDQVASRYPGHAWLPLMAG